jgi:aminoglycoside phosphotransferase (APT) family kinase protein
MSFVHHLDKVRQVVFKQGWEASAQVHDLTYDDMVAMVATLAPNQALQGWEKLSGGLSHATFKVLLPEGPCIVRLAGHASKSLYKEQALAQHLQEDIPVAQIFHIAPVDRGVAALMEWRHGATLSTLISWGIDDHTLGRLAREAAHILARLQKYPFSTAGFLDSTLHVERAFEEAEHATFLLSCLSNPCVQQVLGRALCIQIETLLGRLAPLLAPLKNPHLVHGDFDPANLLVTQENDTWHISTVLDWEYAFAGSYHQDMANWLRWAPQLPEVYGREFLNELGAHGVRLDKEDMTTVALLDLCALLDLLARSNPDHQPKRCEALKCLITHPLGSLTHERDAF